MSEKYQDYTDIPKPKVSTEEIVQRKKTRIVDTIAKVVTLFLAFLFWLYVVATNDATKVEEKKFEVVPVEVRGSETISSHGLAIQNLSFSNLDVMLKGTRSALSDVKAADVKAYINIADVTEPGVYTRTVLYDIPTGVAISDTVGKREVEVTVDTVSIKSFDVNAASVFVGNFSLPESCSIDRTNVTLNIDYVKLEAPSLILNRIVDVRVRSIDPLTLETNTTLSAAVEALDAQGAVVTSSSLKITASLNGVVRSGVTVTVPLIKEKLLPLSIREKDGLVTSDKIMISPAYVLVKGTPTALDALNTVTLDSFSAKTLKTDENGKASFTASLGTLPQGVNKITLSDGSAIAENGITVTVDLMKEKTLMVPKSYVTVLNGYADVVGDYVALTVRAVSDDTYFSLLEKALSEGKEGISLVANLMSVTLDGDTEVDITVVFAPSYEGKLYEVLSSGKAHTVTLRASVR